MSSNRNESEAQAGERWNEYVVDCVFEDLALLRSQFSGSEFVALDRTQTTLNNGSLIGVDMRNVLKSNQRLMGMQRTVSGQKTISVLKSSLDRFGLILVHAVIEQKNGSNFNLYSGIINAHMDATSAEIISNDGIDRAVDTILHQTVVVLAKKEGSNYIVQSFEPLALIRGNGIVRKLSQEFVTILNMKEERTTTTRFIYAPNMSIHPTAIPRTRWLNRAVTFTACMDQPSGSVEFLDGCRIKAISVHIIPDESPVSSMMDLIQVMDDGLYPETLEKLSTLTPTSTMIANSTEIPSATANNEDLLFNLNPTPVQVQKNNNQTTIKNKWAKELERMMAESVEDIGNKKSGISVMPVSNEAIVEQEHSTVEIVEYNHKFKVMNIRPQFKEENEIAWMISRNGRTFGDISSMGKKTNGKARTQSLSSHVSNGIIENSNNFGQSIESGSIEEISTQIERNSAEVDTLTESTNDDGHLSHVLMELNELNVSSSEKREQSSLI